MNQLTVSLWGDEAWAATLINKSIPEIIQFVSRDTSPPLYYLLAHLWTRVFGISEIGLRSLSVFFWLLTAVFAGLIAHHFWKNRTITIFAFIVTVLNPFLFQYAFEARMYAILALMSTAATYFFLTKKWSLYVIFAVLSLYSHHFSLFVIFWHFLWILITIKRQKLNLIKSLTPFFFIFLFYLPWLPVMYSQTKMVAVNGFWLSRPHPRDLFEIILKFIAGANKFSLQSLSIIIAIFILLLKRWSWRDTAAQFLLGWLFVPLLVVYGLSQIIQPIFYDRYLINLVPAFTLLLVGKSRSPKLYPVLLISFIFILFGINFWFFTHPTKRPFRDLAAYIQKTRFPDETLINWNGSSHHLFESKYYGVYAPIYTPGGPLPFYTGTALMDPTDQISTLPDSSAIGVITSESIDQVNLPDYDKVIEKHFADLVYSRWLKY